MQKDLADPYQCFEYLMNSFQIYQSNNILIVNYLQLDIVCLMNKHRRRKEIVKRKKKKKKKKKEKKWKLFVKKL